MDLAASPVAVVLNALCPSGTAHQVPDGISPSHYRSLAYRPIHWTGVWSPRLRRDGACGLCLRGFRSEEHTSELQSLMRISYAVFCLQIKLTEKTTTTDK